MPRTSNPAVGQIAHDQPRATPVGRWRGVGTWALAWCAQFVLRSGPVSRSGWAKLSHWISRLGRVDAHARRSVWRLSTTGLVALTAPEGFGAALVTGPGSFVAELEGVRLDEGDVKDAEKLREIATRHKSVKTFPRTRLADD